MNGRDIEGIGIVIALFIALIGTIIGATYYSTSQITGEIKDARDLVLGRLSTQIQYIALPPPIAAISATPTTINEGESVSFSGIGSTDPNGNVELYAWKFGDGNTASGIDVTHTYSISGSYTATLTVTDDDALSDVDTVVITVNPIPTTPAPTTTPPPTPAPTTTAPPITTPPPTTTPSTPFVDITKPKDKDKVSWRYLVEGSSSAIKDSGLSAYVLTWPIESDGPWWAQPTTTFSDGSWQSYAYFGRDPKLYPGDIGTTYRVVAIITTQKLSGGQTFRELPEDVARSEEIIVTRT